MTKDDAYYDGLEDYKYGTYRQEQIDMKDMAKVEFGRTFTKMRDRDPNPHVPFAEPGPVMTRTEANILFVIGIAAVFALAAIGYLAVTS